MREIRHYVCDICGTEYANRGKAETCEKSHKTPKKITYCYYRPISDDKSGYPQRITVEMSDGEKVLYQR